jgi:carotenoid cleavage dioxygenase-like enzyme
MPTYHALDPDTLETRTYDPFGGQVKAKTFTAHPKVDPFTDELVTYGYEAKGLCSLDIVVYTFDKTGQVRDEHWLEAPWPGMIHDCAISENFITLVIWPFDRYGTHQGRRASLELEPFTPGHFCRRAKTTG